MTALQQNTDLRLQALESRVVIKLSVVMTALIAAAGTHAFSVPTAQQVAPDPRYLEFVEYAGIAGK